MHLSLMLREGARPEVVRDNMGHANIDVTQNVYGKSWWEERVEAVTRAAAANPGLTPSPPSISPSRSPAELIRFLTSGLLMIQEFLRWIHTSRLIRTNPPKGPVRLNRILKCA